MAIIYKENIKTFIRQIDLLLTPFSLVVTKEKPALITFLFHKIFKNNNEIHSNIVNPFECITIEYFRRFIEYYLNNEYIFISPQTILNRLDSDKKYVLITFDDGYFNNSYILPTLNEFKVPAVFFILSNHVKHNKCFWWDVLYREGRKRGHAVKKILAEGRRLMLKTSAEINDYMENMFGKACFEPIGDIDRPFTRKELKDFSNEEYVILGNHTRDHVNLKQQSVIEIRTQIADSQEIIYDITGIKPTIISYPYGEYTNEVLKIANENGLKLGLTTEAKKNYLPINFDDNDALRLGRFILYGDKRVDKQCETIRSDISLYSRLLNILKRTN